MDKKDEPQRITPAGLPELAELYFSCLNKIGFDTACIFGGAVRDTDYSARNKVAIPVNDYDIRVWVPQDDFWGAVNKFCEQILTFDGAEVEKLHWWAPHKPRYEVRLSGGKMDVSFRGASEEALNNSARFANIARDRAQGSDVGISAIALASDLTCWAMPEYLQDCANRTITVYPSNHDESSLAYADRLIRQKFTTHTVVRAQKRDLIFV